MPKILRGWTVVEGEQLSNGEKFYLGLAVSQGMDEKQAIPSWRRMKSDFSNTSFPGPSPGFRQTKKAVVGIMTPLPVFGMPSNPMMARMGQQGQEPWALVTELKKRFHRQADRNGRRQD